MVTSGTSRLARVIFLGALVAIASAQAAPGEASAACTSASACSIAATDPAAGSGEVVASAPAAAPAPATIAFEAGTTSGDRYSRTTIGTFSMTVPFADSGTVRTSYRFAGRRIRATAILIGARGVFTLSLGGASGATVAGHQSAAGRWRVCGGTDAYRHLHGHGRWGADADFGLGAPGMLAPTIRGSLIGRLYRGSTPGYAGDRSPHDAHC